MDKVCYLGDMLNVDGGGDAAMEARIQIGWNKLRQLVPLVTDFEKETVQQLWAK